MIDLEMRRVLYASSGVLIDSLHGRARVIEPFDRPVVPLGAMSECAVLIELRLCLPVVRAQAGPQPCAWCKKSRGWKHCREHEFVEALERAVACVTDVGRAWDWARALGYLYSDALYASGYWDRDDVERPVCIDDPPVYVRGCTDDAADYARAVAEVCSGLS